MRREGVMKGELSEYFFKNMNSRCKVTEIGLTHRNQNPPYEPNTSFWKKIKIHTEHSTVYKYMYV